MILGCRGSGAAAMMSGVSRWNATVQSTARYRYQCTHPQAAMKGGENRIGRVGLGYRGGDEMSGFADGGRDGAASGSVETEKGHFV